MKIAKKADNGNRTRLSSLGSWRSTDELYLHGSSIPPGNQKGKKNLLYQQMVLKMVLSKMITV